MDQLLSPTLCGALWAASLLLPQPAAAQAAPDPVRPAGTLGFDVPIHEETIPNCTGTELWASRDRYKVSFHDGVAFYPVLGTDYEHNLPVTWRTTSIRAGDRELAVDAPRATSTDWRHELRHGPVVEAYDVRVDGLEQTFVLDAPLAGDGDLVIRGRLTTDLVADATAAPRHGDVMFRDDAGRPIVAYGAATVLDAAGRATPIETAWDGAEIRLRVGRDWLDRATYPVTVDPLLTSKVLLSATTVSHNPSVARSRGSRTLVMDSRATSASDYDTMGVSTVDGLGSPVLIFSHVSSSISTPHTRAAYVHDADRWCVAFEVKQRILTFTFNSVAWFLRRPADTAFRSITATTITGNSDRRPVVGGDEGGILPGSNALIAFERGSGASSAIYGAVIDCENDALLRTQQLSEPSAMRCEFPDVVEQIEMQLDPWVVVWQEEGAATRRQLRMVWVFNDGDITSVYPAGHQNDLTRHNLKPKIDGHGGTYAIAFLSLDVSKTPASDPTGSELWIDSFRLNYIVGQTVGKRHQPLHRLRSYFNLKTEDVAFDTETRSHWGVLSESFFLTPTTTFHRIGYDGQAAEAATVSSNGDGLGLTYSPRTHSFPIVFCDGTILRGAEAAYPAMPAPTQFGQSCNFGVLDSELTHGNLPWAGHERFELRFGPVTQQIDAGVLLLGAQAVDLPILGNCRLYVSPLVSLPFSTSSAATHEFRLALPTAAQGQLHAQVAYVTRSTGQFGTTNGYTFDIVR